jgi:hypothetical protein
MLILSVILPCAFKLNVIRQSVIALIVVDYLRFEEFRDVESDGEDSHWDDVEEDPGGVVHRHILGPML